MSKLLYVVNMEHAPHNKEVEFFRNRRLMRAALAIAEDSNGVTRFPRARFVEPPFVSPDQQAGYDYLHERLAESMKLDGAPLLHERFAGERRSASHPANVGHFLAESDILIAPMHKLSELQDVYKRFTGEEFAEVRSYLATGILIPIAGQVETIRRFATHG